MAEYRNYRETLFPPVSAARIAKLTALFCAGLLGGFLVLNVAFTRRFWRPAIPRFQQVLAETAALRDRINVLFLGPSHVMLGVDPAAFDQATAAAGGAAPLGATFSYNFSVEALRLSERKYLLARLKDIGLPRLRFVLVKPDIWIHVTAENAFSTRARYFDSVDNTMSDLRVRMASSRPLLPYRIGTSSLIAFAGFLGLTNLGVLSDLYLPDKPHAPAPERNGPNPAALRGYQPQPAARPSLPGLTDEDPYPLGPAALDGPVRDLGEAEVAVLRDLVADIRALGAQPIFFIPPVGADNITESRETLKACRTHFPEIPVLAYFYGSGHDELYRRLAYWQDKDHLSLAGAAQLAPLLAKDFVSVTAAQQASR